MMSCDMFGIILLPCSSLTLSCLSVGPVRFVGIVMLMFHHLMAAKTKLQMEAALSVRVVTSVWLCVFLYSWLVWCYQVDLKHIAFILYRIYVAGRLQALSCLMVLIILANRSKLFFSLREVPTFFFYAGATLLEGLCVCKVEVSDWCAIRRKTQTLLITSKTSAKQRQENQNGVKMK